MQITYAVGNFMQPNIVTLDVKSALKEAIGTMVDQGIGSVVITKKGQPVGILTERDVLKRIRREPDSLSVSVAEIMSTPLVTIDAQAAIGEAAAAMAGRRIRRLLITEGGAIGGIITERDILRATLDVFKMLSDAWV